MCLGQGLARLELKLFVINIVRDYDMEMTSYSEKSVPMIGVIPNLKLIPKKTL